MTLCKGRVSYSNKLNIKWIYSLRGGWLLKQTCWSLHKVRKKLALIQLRPGVYKNINRIGNLQREPRAGGKVQGHGTVILPLDRNVGGVLGFPRYIWPDHAICLKQGRSCRVWLMITLVVQILHWLVNHSTGGQVMQCLVNDYTYL
jgi:hypothetical protein